jgi:DNA-binding XRE family transcriptional regulator
MELKNIKLIYTGFKGGSHHAQYIVKNWHLLEEYRLNNIMTKDEMANHIGLGKRSYENITYNKEISIRAAKKIKQFIERRTNG